MVIKQTWVKIAGLILSVGSWTIDEYINGENILTIKDIYLKDREQAIFFLKTMLDILK